MVIKVGINSFGRIGRVIFRTICENSETEVSAINDPAIDSEYMCYLIKFDSTHGKFSGNVSHQGDEIQINDHTVQVFHRKVPADIPWDKAGVQYVVEASGMFTTVEKASGHLIREGVRRVIVTAPSADAPMLILGVNEDSIQPGHTNHTNVVDMKVVSCASSTLYCLAPIIKILEDAYGVGDGFVTSIHAMTPSLKPLDGLCVRGKHWRDHRSIHQNIIPATTGACRALGKILPRSKDKLAGLAFRVPVVNGSVLDLCVRLKKSTTIAEISQTIEKSHNSLLNIIKVSNEKAVSSDFAGDTHSCILDVDSSMQIKPNFFKLICWYENEYSYSCRVVDTVLFSERQFREQISPPTRIMYRRALPNIIQDSLRMPCESFCVSDLRTIRSNKTPGLVTQFTGKCSSKPEHITFSERQEYMQSYIDKLTKCLRDKKENKTEAFTMKKGTNSGRKEEKKCSTACNKKLNKTEVLKMKKGTPEEEERDIGQIYLQNVEKDIEETLSMAHCLLNKLSNKKLSLKPGIKKESDKELSESRIMMRKSIIAKISDTLEKMRKVKNNDQKNGVEYHNSLLSGTDGYQVKVNIPTQTADSLYNSHSELLKSSSYTLLNSTVSWKKSHTLLIEKDHHEDLGTEINLNLSVTKLNSVEITKDLEVQINKENKINLSEEKCKSVENDSARTAANMGSEKNPLNLMTSHLPDNTKENDTNLNKTYLDHTADKNNVSPHENIIKIVDSEMKESIATHNTKQDLDETIGETSMQKINNEDEFVDFAADKTLDSTPIPTSPECSFIENIPQKSISGLISNYTGLSTGVSKRNSFIRNIEDVYDKLDSESSSGSGSSYRVHEKTSQVINISDLTYSLEDLERLDKVCRVLEISDELSDKLFSPLDNENYENKSGKEWSFQDLCNRIKFDEFFDKLFENPAS